MTSSKDLDVVVAPTVQFLLKQVYVAHKKEIQSLQNKIKELEEKLTESESLRTTCQCSNNKNELPLNKQKEDNFEAFKSISDSINKQVKPHHEQKRTKRGAEKIEISTQKTNEADFNLSTRSKSPTSSHNESSDKDFSFVEPSPFKKNKMTYQSYMSNNTFSQSLIPPIYKRKTAIQSNTTNSNGTLPNISLLNKYLPNETEDDSDDEPLEPLYLRLNKIESNLSSNKDQNINVSKQSTNLLDQYFGGDLTPEVIQDVQKPSSSNLHKAINELYEKEIVPIKSVPQNDEVEIVETKPAIVVGNQKIIAKQPIYDSFDMPSEVETQINYKYKRDAVRKKDDRGRLQGQTCRECEKFNAHLPEEERIKRLKLCSRHRDNFITPLTPEHYWDPDFASTPEAIERGMIKETEVVVLNTRNNRKNKLRLPKKM